MDPQPEKSPQKKARQAGLHENHFVPWSFYLDAINQPDSFLKGGEESKFGRDNEAYLRPCHVELLNKIIQVSEEWQVKKTRTMHLVEIRGSSGIGKSAFLAYVIANMLQVDAISSFAIFYSEKGQTRDEIKCSVWIKGKLKEDRVRYGDAEFQTKLDKTYLKQLEGLFMDGCSVGFQLQDFSGFAIAAVSPSVSTQGLRNKLGATRSYTILNMPCWTRSEVDEVAQMLGEDSQQIEENFQYMRGMVRYMFEKDAAREHIEEAVKRVNPLVISSMLATQQTDKDADQSMVHSLVRWEVQKSSGGEYEYEKDVRFQLVSRYAETLVAKKLRAYDLEKLNKTRSELAPLSGAAGYVGAIFEAYAIRRFLLGGAFVLQSLEGEDTKETIEVPQLGEDDLQVLEANILSKTTVPLDRVHRRHSSGGGWSPKLLWPTTTNFPTFDAAYFHTDGEVYALQMTIAKKHELKNNGTHQMMEYLDKIDTAKKPYNAVFVIPGQDWMTFKRQAFSGDVIEGKNCVSPAKQATPMVNENFRQWVIQLD